MTLDWKQWEGQVVDGTFVLRQYLMGVETHGLFLTEYVHKDAALKLVVADDSSDAQIARWTEAAMLSHPNLIQIYRTGRCRFDDTDLLFLVTEYADEDLSQVLPIRPLTPTETSDMLRPVLGTLEYLHRRGLVHGRLEPGNIMAIGDRVKLASDSVGPASGSRAPSPKPPTWVPGPYDPPEAAKGEVSPAADIWSLGMTICEVVTQRLPEWDRSQSVEPALPENLPDPFLDIVRNSLRLDPKLRWSIAQISARLRAPSGTAAAAAAGATAKAPEAQAKATAPPEQTPVPAAVTTPSKPTPNVPNPSPKSSGKWYILGLSAAAVIVVLLVAIAGPRFFHVSTEVGSAAPQTVPTQPAAEPQSSGSTAMESAHTGSAAAAVLTGTPQEKPSAGLRLSGTPSRNTTAAAVPPGSVAPSPAVAPTVKVVTNGVDETEIVHQVVPDVPQKARDTITGKIRIMVKIQVDSAGKVVNAELATPASSQYFSTLAVQAAQKWQFAPGTEETRERTLQFAFAKNATEVVLARATP